MNRYFAGFFVTLSLRKLTVMIETITMLGAGNLATSLGKAFKNAGLTINQVYSRTEQAAKTLGQQLKCQHTTDLSEVEGGDLIVIAVKDDVIPGLLSELNIRDSILVHTAGSVPMSVLATRAGQVGVFYPLQTFSKSRQVDFTEIPICLEAQSAEVLAPLESLARKLSRQVVVVDSNARKTLHLSAVFTCNFVNHFYHIGHALLEEKGLDFDLLKPLISETAKKVMEMNPADAQTGPAVRFDETIINNHLDLLADKPELQKLYRFVSESIYNTQKQK